MILKYFNVLTLVIADPQHEDTGLQAYDWHEKLPFLLVLRTLMRDWVGLKLTPLLLPDRESHDMYTEAEVQQLEGSIVHFYTQSLYELFGHAAVIPT